MCIQFTYLEGLFIHICVVAHICLLGLAKEYEFLKEENVSEAFFLSERYKELVLTYELALLLQINLQ